MYQVIESKPITSYTGGCFLGNFEAIAASLFKSGRRRVEINTSRAMTGIPDIEERDKRSNVILTARILLMYV